MHSTFSLLEFNCVTCDFSGNILARLVDTFEIGDMPYNFAVGNESFSWRYHTMQYKAHSINSCSKMQTQMSYSVDNANCRRQLNYGVVPILILLSSDSVAK